MEFKPKNCKGKFIINSKTATVGTQKPTQDDIIDEIVNGVDAKSVAQTQLNLLLETLENLKKNGVLTHLNMSEKDLEIIREEMRILIVEKAFIEEQNSKYIPANRTLYTGGGSHKAAGVLNLGKKDPIIHYAKETTYHNMPPRKSKSKLGIKTVSKLGKKNKK